MLAERFSLAKEAKQDAVVTALHPQHQASLTWLREYFLGKALRIGLLRNETAFHYEGPRHGPSGEEPGAWRRDASNDQTGSDGLITNSRADCGT